MREIKFRAWNKKEKIMVTNNEDDSSDYWDGVASSDIGMINFLLCKTSNYEYMQYTGLSDKNGVEIYEGDILRVSQEDEHIPNRDSGGGIIDYDREEGFSQVGVVSFTSCSFDYKTVKTVAGKHEEIHAPIDWINNYEVIGNLYENPNLLEGESK